MRGLRRTQPPGVRDLLELLVAAIRLGGTRIGEVARAFESALLTASCAMTRPAPNIRAKVMARNEAVLAVRPLVHAIKANPAISRGKFLCFGLR